MIAETRQERTEGVVSQGHDNICPSRRNDVYYR